MNLEGGSATNTALERRSATKWTHALVSELRSFYVAVLVGMGLEIILLFGLLVVNSFF